MATSEQAATVEEGMTLEEVHEEILRDYRMRFRLRRTGSASSGPIEF